MLITSLPDIAVHVYAYQIEQISLGYVFLEQANEHFFVYSRPSN